MAHGGKLYKTKNIIQEIQYYLGSWQPETYVDSKVITDSFIFPANIC